MRAEAPEPRGEPRQAGEAAPSALRAQRLRKRYKSRTVVQDVSLEVGSGEVVGLLGPNGAGKTTCFYMIVGLVPSDGGTIELDGENLSHLPIHQRARRYMGRPVTSWPSISMVPVSAGIRPEIM